MTSGRVSPLRIVRSSPVLARLAAVAFFITAGLHSFAYRTITAISNVGPPDLRPVVPAIWLAFSLMLVVLGLIIASNATAPPSRYRMQTLILAGIFAFGSATLQMIFFGFIPPVAILCVDGALAVAAAVIGPTPQE